MALRTRNPGPLLRPEGMITVQDAGRGDHHQVEVGMGTHLLEVGVGVDIELRDGSTPAFSGEGRATAQSAVIPAREPARNAGSPRTAPTRPRRRPRALLQSRFRMGPPHCGAAKAIRTRRPPPGGRHRYSRGTRGGGDPRCGRARIPHRIRTDSRIAVRSLPLISMSTKLGQQTRSIPEGARKPREMAMALIAWLRAPAPTVWISACLCSRMVPASAPATLFGSEFELTRSTSTMGEPPCFRAVAMSGSSGTGQGHECFRVTAAMQ